MEDSLTRVQSWGATFSEFFGSGTSDFSLINWDAPGPPLLRKVAPTFFAGLTIWGVAMGSKCYQRQWREARPGYVAAKAKEWRKENQERIREYKRAHPLTPEQRRRYNAQARERYRVIPKRDRRQYYEANKEQRREYTRQWRRENPDKAVALKQRRRARLAAAPINDLTAAQWQAVLAHYGHKCAYCSAAKNLTQDHIIPLSRAGPHTISNVTPACRSCNSRKGTRTPSEAAMFLWQLPLTHAQYQSQSPSSISEP